jgi:hypothetical protein
LFNLLNSKFKTENKFKFNHVAFHLVPIMIMNINYEAFVTIDKS